MSFKLGKNNLFKQSGICRNHINNFSPFYLQIRRTSMILRSNNISSSSTTSSQSSNGTVMQKPNTPNGNQTNALTLKLKTNANVVTTTTTTASTSSSQSQQQQPALIYSPPSPLSPHTMATKCGFSPNVTTQSCTVIDDKDAQIKSLQGEIVSLKDVIKSRDAEIVKLRREIHKLKVSERRRLWKILRYI